MKRMFNHLLKESIGLTLFILYLAFPFKKSKILSIYFHNPSPFLFEKVIRFLAGKSYRFISVKELNQIIDDKVSKGKIALITFDDGWKENLKLIEIAKKYNVKLTIFVSTSALEHGNFWWEYVGIDENRTKASIKQDIVRIKKLEIKDFFKELETLKSGTAIGRSVITKEELQQLSKEEFITIGAHTVNHFSLPERPVDIQKKELLDSKKALEMLTGMEVSYFSYPGGDYDDELKRIAKECGYKMCFTIDPKAIDLRSVDKYSISRRCINDDAGYFEALSKLYGIWYHFNK